MLFTFLFQHSTAFVQYLHQRRQTSTLFSRPALYGVPCFPDSQFIDYSVVSHYPGFQQSTAFAQYQCFFAFWPAKGLGPLLLLHFAS